MYVVLHVYEIILFSCKNLLIVIQFFSFNGSLHPSLTSREEKFFRLACIMANVSCIKFLSTDQQEEVNLIYNSWESVALALKIDLCGRRKIMCEKRNPQTCISINGLNS